MLDEDNFHDTYLFVRKQVLVPGKDITDYDAYFIGCYKKAALIKIKRENRYAHPEDDFFLRCGEEAKFLSEDDLNGCERLVRDILRFVRQKFSYEEYRMFMLRFYEAQFSFKALAECMGISASAISQKVCLSLIHIYVRRRYSNPSASVLFPVHRTKCRNGYQL